MTKTYFVTTDAYMHQNLFQGDEAANLLITTILKYRDAGEFLVHEFVVMPNHLHLTLSIDDDHSLGRAVQLVKGGYSHALKGIGITRKAVWQPSYYDHRVRDREDQRRIREYIHNNPVRRRLVDTAAEFPYSSAAERFRMDEVPEGLKPQIHESELTPA